MPLARVLLFRRGVMPVQVAADEFVGEQRDVDLLVTRWVLTRLQEQHRRFVVFRQAACQHSPGCTAANCTCGEYFVCLIQELGSYYLLHTFRMVYDRLYGYKASIGLLNSVAKSSIGTYYYLTHIPFKRIYIYTFLSWSLRPNSHNKSIITMTGSSSDLSLTMLLCKMAVQTQTNWYRERGSVMIIRRISCRNVGSKRIGLL